MSKIEVMRLIITCLLLYVFLDARSQDSVIVFHKKSPLPSTPRIESGYFVIDSNLYIVGGTDSTLALYKEVWKYNLYLDSWHQLEDFPGGRMFGAGSFVIQNKGYIISGEDSLDVHTSHVWEYEPTTDTWSQKADFPGVQRDAASCFSYENIGFIGLGYSELGNDLWKYDPISDQWTEMDSLPSDGRYGTSVSVIDSFAYFIGGYYMFNIGYATSEVWKYHIQANSWERVADIPGLPRAFGPSWGFRNYLISGLGISLDTLGDQPFLSDKYSYNPITNNWRSIVFQNFIDSLGDGISFTIGNTGYYFGGQRSDVVYSFSNDLYSFDATPLLTTGITETQSNNPFSLYPNPISSQNTLTISTSQSGEIDFYNSIGQVIYASRLDAGDNHISCELLNCNAGIVFYRATLRDGTARNGKVVVY